MFSPLPFLQPSDKTNSRRFINQEVVCLRLYAIILNCMLPRETQKDCEGKSFLTFPLDGMINNLKPIPGSGRSQDFKKECL